MKLLGNTTYGNTLTNKDKHTDVSYCEKTTTTKHVNSPLFRKLALLIDDIYEVELKKKRK